MPPTLSKPSGAAPASIFYITLGAIMTVWSGVWYMYQSHNHSSQAASYVCMGFLATGVVLLLIGFTMGPLQRLARHAELPPAEVTPPAPQTADPALTTRRVV